LSHFSFETQLEYASQRRNETHSPPASQKMDETQVNFASQENCETHTVTASQRRRETHGSIAGRLTEALT